LVTYTGTGRIGAADGPLIVASFSHPKANLLNVHGDVIASDPSSKRIRLIRNGQVSTLLRSKLFPGVSIPDSITGLAVIPDGNIIISAAIGLFQLNPPPEIAARLAPTLASSTLEHLPDEPFHDGFTGLIAVDQSQCDYYGSN